LRLGSIGVAPLHDVRVEGGRIHYRTEPGAPEKSVKLSEVSLENVLDYADIPEADEPAKFTAAVLRLARLLTVEGPRVQRQQIGELHDRIAAAFGLAPLSDFAKRLDDYVKQVRATLDQAIESSERAAQEGYLRAKQHMAAGEWREAYEILKDLVENPVFKETDFVKEKREFIEKDFEEARKRLPVADLREYFGGRAVYVEGTRVGSGHYRAVVMFDLEDATELTRFAYTPGRIDLVRAERPLLGPAGPDAPAPLDETRVEHLLAFLPPARMPEDGLNLHPLSIECPFLYSRPMSISFRARWPRPIALLVSLAGTNVVVLSDDGRRENGRGVFIWQSDDLRRPDAVVPGDLRKEYIDRNPGVLAGDAKRHRYFQFESDREYRIRFEKTEKYATLLVDDHEVWRQEVRKYSDDTGQIVIRTWSPMEVDELRIEGTIDPEWYQSMKRRLK
jgi:hypothetical protein